MPSWNLHMIRAWIRCSLSKEGCRCGSVEAALLEDTNMPQFIGKVALALLLNCVRGSRWGKGMLDHCHTTGLSKAKDKMAPFPASCTEGNWIIIFLFYFSIGARMVNLFQTLPHGRIEHSCKAKRWVALALCYVVCALSLRDALDSNTGTPPSCSNAQQKKMVASSLKGYGWFFLRQHWKKVHPKSYFLTFPFLPFQPGGIFGIDINPCSFKITLCFFLQATGTVISFAGCTMF